MTLLTIASLTGGYGETDILNGIDLTVEQGEILTVAGTNGAGKSTLAKAVMGLLPSTAQITGAIEFEGQSLLGLDDNRLSKIRGKDLAMVFQDPLSALTPVYTVGDQIAEALRLHDSHLSAGAAAARAVELLSAALGDVAGFVRTNTDLLSTNVDKLADVTLALVQQRAALAG